MTPFSLLGQLQALLLSPPDDHQNIGHGTNPLFEDDIFTPPKFSDASHTASIKRLVRIQMMCET